MNKTKIPNDSIKAIELSILNDIDRFCRDHKLQYWLAYGTLLGAIRHQGFIPWDDDIDIFMFRDDYEQFLNTYNTQTSQYKVLIFSTIVNPSACASALEKLAKT